MGALCSTNKNNIADTDNKKKRGKIMHTVDSFVLYGKAKKENYSGSDSNSNPD